MKRSAVAIVSILFLLLATTVFGGSAFAGEKRVLLKCPVAFPTATPGLGTTIKWFADRIGTASNGSVKMKTYEPGKLVASFEILDAVSKGSVNSGYCISGYWEGKIPGMSVFSSVPYGPEPSEFLAWIYYGNGRKLYQKAYTENGYNVHVIPFGIYAPETAGWFKKPIKSIEDFKGLKIRFYGLGGKVLQRLGASVALIPGSELFPALEKGAIDATEYSMPAVDRNLGFYKVAKYNIFPGWHQPATLFEILINGDTWKELSDSQKMVIEMTAMASTLDSLAYTEAIQPAAMKENVAKGAELVYLPDEVLNQLKDAWEATAEDLAKDAPVFKEAWEDMKAFRKEYSLWKKYAFLPRPRPDLGN